MTKEGCRGSFFIRGSLFVSLSPEGGSGRTERSLLFLFCFTGRPFGGALPAAALPPALPQAAEAPAGIPVQILPEEQAMMQGLIDKMYLRFKNVVRNGRGPEARKEVENARPLTDNWESFADGRILMGSEAYDAGLVDELGSEEEVMAAVARLTKGEGRPQVIRYESPMDWRGILKFFAQSHTPGVVKVELNGLNINGSSVMEPGKLYFLPPGE